MTSLQVPQSAVIALLFAVASGHFVGLLRTHNTPEKAAYHVLGIQWPTFIAGGLQMQSAAMLAAGSVVYCVYLGALWTEGE
jgi:hypothetical protein